MLYFRKLLIICALFVFIPQKAYSLDPFSAFLIGRTTEKALDLIFSPKEPPSIYNNDNSGNLAGAGTFSQGAWETVFAKNAEHTTASSINNAKHSIIIMANSIVSENMARQLKRAMDNKIKVLIIGNKTSNKNYIANLAKYGVPVKIANKYINIEFMVIDGKNIQIGFPKDKNIIDNILVIKDVQEMAGVYAREWKNVWDNSKFLKFGR